MTLNYHQRHTIEKVFIAGKKLSLAIKAPQVEVKKPSNYISFSTVKEIEYRLKQNNSSIISRINYVYINNKKGSFEVWGSKKSGIAIAAFVENSIQSYIDYTSGSIDDGIIYSFIDIDKDRSYLAQLESLNNSVVVKEELIDTSANINKLIIKEISNSNVVNVFKINIGKTTNVLSEFEADIVNINIALKDFLKFSFNKKTLVYAKNKILCLKHLYILTIACLFAFALVYAQQNKLLISEESSQLLESSTAIINEQIFDTYVFDASEQLNNIYNATIAKVWLLQNIKTITYKKNNLTFEGESDFNNDFFINKIKKLDNSKVKTNKELYAWEYNENIKSNSEPISEANLNKDNLLIITQLHKVLEKNRIDIYIDEHRTRARSSLYSIKLEPRIKTLYSIKAVADVLKQFKHLSLNTVDVIFKQNQIDKLTINVYARTKN